jgi:hypothetical protein
MTDEHQSIAPLDPGRISSMDPAELRYWCSEFHCSETDLRNAIASVGEHVTAVREQLASTVQPGRHGP